MYCTVLCYHPYLVSMLFADLVSLHLVTFVMFFILVYTVTMHLFKVVSVTVGSEGSILLQ